MVRSAAYEANAHSTSAATIAVALMHTLPFPPELQQRLARINHVGLLEDGQKLGRMFDRYIGCINQVF